eukprot:192988_1
MLDFSPEYWVWTIQLFIINAIFLCIIINYLSVSYKVLADDVSIKINGISELQRFMLRMRWIAFILILLRLIFLLIYAINDGQLPMDYTLHWHNIPRCIYILFYYILLVISIDGKIVYIIVMFQSSASLLLRIYAMDTIQFRIDRRKHTRFKHIIYGGYIVIVCKTLQCIVEMTFWLIPDQKDEDKEYEILDLGLYCLTFALFWIALGVFVCNLFGLRSRSIRAYNKASHAMPEYKKLYFQAIMKRLQYSVPLFVVWLVLYLSWNALDVTHHVLKTVDVYSNRMEYHIGLYWVYWILCDSILFVAVLQYMKPQITTSVLQKYSRPINVRRSRNRQISVEQVY